MASLNFKLNSQHVCFLRFLSKMTNWGSDFLLKTLRCAHWSSPRAPGGKGLLVICVWVRQQNTAVLTGVFGVRVCSVSLCLFEFVKACGGCCAPVSTDWLTPHACERDSDSWVTSKPLNSSIVPLMNQTCMEMVALAEELFIPVSKWIHTLLPFETGCSGTNSECASYCRVAVE